MFSSTAIPSAQTAGPRYDAWFIRVCLKPWQLLLLVTIDELSNIHRTAEELGMT